MVILQITKPNMTTQNTQSQKNFNENLSFPEKPS